MAAINGDKLMGINNVLDQKNIKDTCLTGTKKAWLGTSDFYPDFLPVVSDTVKEENEKKIQRLMIQFKKQLKRFPGQLPGSVPNHVKNDAKLQQWKLQMRKLLDQVIPNDTLFNIENAMDRQTTGKFQGALEDFLKQARKFSPELSAEGLGQAARNFLVFTMFEEINQIAPSFSNSSFGYSMLYPFTDNYIDNTTCTDEDKVQYNQLIRDQIEGRAVHPRSMHQDKTCRLIQMIRDDYAGEQKTVVSMLLLMMLEAQQDSLRQQNRAEVLTREERLDISLVKGGVSVLIDRFLVDREITAEDLSFYLGFGFFLQLTDDLQDIKEDSLSGNQTIFTLGLSCEKEEQIVNRMFHFIHGLMKEDRPDQDAFRDFILSNCYLLIYASVFRSRDYFSTDFLKRIEKSFPVTLSSYDRIRQDRMEIREGKNRVNFLEMLDLLL